MTILYHYCSNASFLSIISSRKIYASEFTLSNDLLEGKWIRHVVSNHCKERDLDYFSTETILNELDRLIAYIGAVGICLSEDGDLLSQWRAYATNGSGVSIGFDQEHFAALNSTLPSVQKIIYDPASQKVAIQEAMDAIIGLVNRGAGKPLTLLTRAGMSEEDVRAKKEIDQKFSTAVFSLFPLLYVLKNPAFQEEKEWRSVTIVIPPNPLLPNANSEGSGIYLNHLDFRALPDRIVPHKELSLDGIKGRSAIREVVLGPRNVTPTRVVEAALLRHGWQHIAVRKSNASYR